MPYIAGDPIVQVSRQVTEGAAYDGQTSIPIPGGMVPTMNDVFVGGAALSQGDFDDSDAAQIKLAVSMQQGTQFRVVSYSPGQTVQPVGGQLAGFRNRVINGDCRVQQRPAAQISGPLQYGQVDRFSGFIFGAGGSFSMDHMVVNNNNMVRQVTGTPIVSTSGANGWNGVSHVIEGLNCWDMIGSPAVLSFNFMSNVTGTFSVTIRDIPNTNSFVESFSAVANVLQRVIIPVPALPAGLSVPNSSAGGLAINIGGLNAGTFAAPAGPAWQMGVNAVAASVITNWANAANNYIAIGDVQLEPGTVATPFERRPFGFELSLCQRYYEVGSSVMVCNADLGGVFNNALTVATFKATKRSVPTMTTNITTNLGINSVSGVPSIDSVNFTPGTSAAAGQYAYFSWTASAEL